MRKKKSYICSPTILSWQQILNISLHISLFSPNSVNALSKTVEFGLSQVPSIFPNLVTIPFLQHNFLPRLLRYFLFFFLIRFLMILPTFSVFYYECYSHKLLCSNRNIHHLRRCKDHFFYPIFLR